MVKRHGYQIRNERASSENPAIVQAKANYSGYHGARAAKTKDSESSPAIRRNRAPFFSSDAQSGLAPLLQFLKPTPSFIRSSRSASTTLLALRRPYLPSLSRNRCSHTGLSPKWPPPKQTRPTSSPNSPSAYETSSPATLPSTTPRPSYHPPTQRHHHPQTQKRSRHRTRPTDRQRATRGLTRRNPPPRELYCIRTPNARTRSSRARTIARGDGSVRALDCASRRTW